jgi:hypothetical protein
MELRRLSLLFAFVNLLGLPTAFAAASQDPPSNDQPVPKIPPPCTDKLPHGAECTQTVDVSHGRYFDGAFGLLPGTNGEGAGPAPQDKPESKDNT